MTARQTWRLGAPLTVSLADLARGEDGVETIPLGRLAWSRSRRRAVFEPARGDIPPISPLSLTETGRLLPGDPAEFGGLHGVFADSLPDGWGRLLVDREAEKQSLSRADLTPVDRLAIEGTQGMGALSYAPEAERPEIDAVDLAELANAAERILSDAHEPRSDDASKLRAALGGSGGARPKIVCQIESTEETPCPLLRPAGAPPDPGFAHWLVKFGTQEDGADAAAIEQAYADMARAAGITMPPTRLLEGGAARYFATRRFDRQVIDHADGPRLRRFHMLSASGALESEPNKFAFDYGTLLAWVWRLTRSVPEVEQMFRRAAFNAMAHNRDDHGRQHSALMDLQADGTPRWRVSPAYDLTPSDGPGGEHSLAICGAGRDISRDHLVRLGKATPIPPERIAPILDDVAAAVADWPRYAGDYDLGRGVRTRIAALHSPV